MAAAGQSTEIQYEQEHINESHVPQLIGVFIASLVIAYGAVFWRLVSRRISRTGLSWDDWIIVVSLIFITAFVVPNWVFIRFGFGRHTILVQDPTALSKVILAAEIAYTCGILCFKLSGLCLLQRIFPGQSFKYTLCSIGAFVFAYSITQIFGIIFTCVPMSAIWDPSVEGRCINIIDVYLVCSSMNIATDLIILCLPMPKLWNLKISTTQKVQLSLLFSLGGCVCVVSIVRTAQLKQVSLVDPSYSDYGPCVLSALEMGLGTLCACFPTYRPILHFVFGRRTVLTSDDKAKLTKSSVATVSNKHGLTGLYTNNVHPFRQLEETAIAADSWTSDIPLNNINHTTATGPGSSNLLEVHNLGPNEIKVMTDLEQTSR